MNRFVISCDFIEAIGANRIHIDNLTNVLLTFTQDNPYKIYIDKESILFSRYTEIGKKYEMIRFWLDIIGKSSKEVFCECDSKNKTKKLDLLCLSLASLTQNKTIITSAKDLYLKHHSRKIQKNQIHLIDGDEAKLQLNARTTIINQTTTGRNSPITNNINN